MLCFITLFGGLNFLSFGIDTVDKVLQLLPAALSILQLCLETDTNSVNTFLPYIFIGIARSYKFCRGN